ncbi:MAG: toxin TcdB middle/N-terminal domain-containing protein, partial [Ferruginibacter sp.]
SNPSVLTTGGQLKAMASISYMTGQTANGNITFAVKKRQKLLAKKKLTLLNNYFVGDSTLQFNCVSGDTVYFEFYTDSDSLAKKINNTNAIINTTYYNAGLHAPIVDSLWKFGNLYHGWGQFYYNKDSSFSAIDETKMVLSGYNTTTFPSDFDTTHIKSFSNLQSYFTNHNIPNPLSNIFGIMMPDVDSNVWRGFGDMTMVGANKMSNARKNIIIDETTNYPIPQINYHNGKAIYKYNTNESTSYSASFGPSCFSVGSSFTRSVSELMLDYMDLNGDRYPDIVGPFLTQYSTPQGGIGSLCTSHYTNNDYRINSNISDAIGTTYGVNYPIVIPKASNNPKTSKISVDVNGALSFGSGKNIDETQYTFVDINADGLPDKLAKHGKVYLNLGYSFAPIETWINNNNNIEVRDGKSSSSSLSVGFNIIESSFAGGVGISGSENNNTFQTMDINGDGLQDLVSWEYTPIGLRIMHVQFNKGNGFAAPVIWDTLTNTENSKSYNQSVNLATTFGIVIPIPFFPIKFILSSGVNLSNSLTKEKVQMIDMNADGYLDYVISTEETDVKVRYSTLGKLNILKKVTNNAGSSFELAYELSVNSQKSPQRNWLLSAVTVKDGHPGDGADSMFTKFEYKNPYYSRFERVSFGYDTVITHVYNTLVSTPYVYRTIKEAYHTNKFLFKGIKKYEVLLDSADHKYVETFYTYMHTRIVNGDTVGEAQINCFNNYYPAIASEDKYFYEGAASPAIHTRKNYKHGRWGNVVKYDDLGDLAYNEDDITAEISYDTIISKNLLSLVNSIVVRNLSNLDVLRSRTATYDQNNGKLLQLILENTNNSGNAITDYTYDIYGNTQTLTQPENQNHQRKSFTYTYDPYFTHMYTVSISDEQSLTSTADYDYRFGKPIATIDVAGNVMQYTYDGAGRCRTILAPYEKDAALPFTVKFDYWDDANIELNHIDTVMWSRTRHYDPANHDNEITTVLFADGLGKILQTKKKVSIFDPVSGLDVDSMVVSGKIIYDAFGRTISTNYPITEALGTDSLFNFNIDIQPPTTTQYDVMDRTVSLTTPDNITSYTNYGFENDFFNKLQFKTIQIDALTKETKIYTDTRGLQTTINNALNDTTRFIYNQLGELIESTDPEGNSTTYSYDLLGHRIQRSHPDAGTTVYNYDPAGNVISMQTQNLINQSLSVNYNYDYNKLTEIDYPLNP